MKNATLIASIIAIILSGFALYQSYHTDDYAYVDIQKLISGYKRTPIARKEFEEKTFVLKANADSLMGDWQNELMLFEKERSSLSSRELELKQELLAGKQQKINAYQQSIREQIAKEDQRVTQTVINDINSFVKEYGREKDYVMIFGATGSGTMMYAEEGVDLTDEVLKELNSNFPGE